MKVLFAIAVLLGSIPGAMAADDADYTAYYDAGAAPAARPRAGTARGKHGSIGPVDTRRDDEGRDSVSPGHLTPGYRSPTGFYVPPDYSTHPRDPYGDGFGGFQAPSTGGSSAPNPFVGPLGTRR